MQKGFDVFEDDFDVRNCILKLRVVVGDTMSERDEMRMKVLEFEGNTTPFYVRNLGAPNQIKSNYLCISDRVWLRCRVQEFILEFRGSKERRFESCLMHFFSVRH